MARALFGSPNVFAMRKRLVIDLKNLRETISSEYCVDEYPVELLLGFRAPAGPDVDGWRAMTLDRQRLDYGRLVRRGAVDVAFHHQPSDVMVVSPSLSSGQHWRVIYPGDAVLCSHCIFAVNELLRVRYEIAPLRVEWVRETLQQETPWYITPRSEPEP